MSKSAIYTANTTAQNVAVNGLINPGTVIRRFGCNVHLSGSSINITGTGYYDVDLSMTAAPTAAGNVIVTMYKDGVAIPGATATASTSTANNPVNLSLSCLVREYCPCADDSSNLTFVLSGTAASVTNVAIVVEKI
jgi:hypothetical protein